MLRTSTRDLDGHLTAAQQAEVKAFASLVEARLDPATQQTIWGESQGFNEYYKVNAARGLWRESW